MRHSIVGAGLFAALVIAATAVRSFSEPTLGAVAEPSRVSTTELITHFASPAGQSQVVTVIDPKQRAMAVYDVDRATGKISLKSVRNITWDLQMTEYNSGDPKPQDIRSGLQR